MGVQLSYLLLRIAGEYGSKSALSGTIGLFAKLSNSVEFGFRLINPNRAPLAKEQDERFPTQLTFGIAYRLSKKVSLFTELAKETAAAASINTGIEYEIQNALAIRMGYSSLPATTSFGFGFAFRRWRVDLASIFMGEIGLTSSIGMTYSFPKK